ncbi:phosphatase PAP2 family protein [Orbus sturtevantii]|uniref:acid phosphatase PhoC n=1 Tax=Orbus sturtevantii TaxID=3074109 RepID=UPI00370D2DC9
MKKNLVIVLLLSLFVPASSLAVIPSGDDVTTKPHLYYLTNAQAIDSLALLLPPPEVGSILFLNDQAMYEKGRLLRDTERGKQAAEDANLAAGGVANAFSTAFGYPITEKDSPEIHKLLTNMIEDAGDLATRSAKQYYMRIRPFAFYGVATCNTKEQDKLSTNGSYPSGHTAIGWASALVLAEINPNRQDQILKRGFELGQSRVICGYHWQSDIDSARTVASAVVATLHSNQKFEQQLKKAKTEFAQLSASDKKSR